MSKESPPKYSIKSILSAVVLQGIAALFMSTKKPTYNCFLIFYKTKLQIFTHILCGFQQFVTAYNIRAPPSPI